MTKRLSAQTEQGRFPWDSEGSTGSDAELRPSEVAFFFGAGASVEAGVPDTAGLMDDFVDSLPSGEVGPVREFLSNLSAWAHAQGPPRLVDVELVLETLQQAVNWKTDPLAAFVQGEFEVEGVTPGDLLRSLRDFIKERVMVQAENIKYLAPLRGFVDEYRPLNVFSANYDTAIEVFCAEHKLKYRDGFDEAWNPRVFDEPDIHIRLFKIHGSVTWYRTDRGRFVKIPTMVKGSSVELFTKERAELVMMYPAQKFEYVEPLFELTLQMKRELARCRALFVVGYSFRDEHIRRLFWDIAREYSDFYVVLIDPKADRIFRDRLEHYDDNKTPSSLAERVVCLPYQFGKAFPALQSEIYKAFRQMRTDVDALSASERQGKVAHWQNCILPAAECGDYKTLRMMLEKVSDEKYSNYLALMRSIALALLHAITNDDREFVVYFWNQLRSVVLEAPKSIVLAVEKTSEGNILRPNMFRGQHSPHSVREAWDRARTSVISRLRWIPFNEKHQMFTELLEEIVKNMEIWKSGNARFVDYLTSRAAFVHGNLEVLLKNLARPGDTIWEGKDRREEIETGLRQAEQRVLTSVFEKYEGRILICS